MTSTPNCMLRSAVPSRLLIFAALLGFFWLAAATPAAAQKKEAPIKTVHGVVQDKSDDPISGAIVFLKNLQNNTVKTSFADEAGGYRFSGLDPNTDYEIHAEFKGDVSPTKRLSSLDSRRDIALTLTIRKK
jgi:hypothetical protein